MLFKDCGENYKYPFAFSSSAFKIPPPAAPLIVLWLRPTNLHCKTLHPLSLPTVTAIALSLSLSNLVCGRLSSSLYIIGCFGAKGRFNSCGTPLNFCHIFRISSLFGLFSNSAETHAMWPSITGTLLQCAEISKDSSYAILFPSILPRIFLGSSSDFSSSPLINGITLSNISNDETPGWPAPETACIVVMTTFLILNLLCKTYNGSM